jgi:hypothetical protein
VLYSNNDNILGQYDTNNDPNNQKFKEVGLTEDVLTRVFDHLNNAYPKIGFKSLYHVANAIKAPITPFLADYQLCVKFYEKFNIQFSMLQDGTPLAQNLELQKQLLIKKYSKNPIIAMARVLRTLEAATAFKEFLQQDGDLDIDSQGNAYIGTAVIAITALLTKGNEPSDAMGYNFNEKSLDNFSSDLIKNGKIIPVNQTPWLFSHSGMLYPSKELFENVYKKYIIGGDGIRKYGKIEL